MRFLIYSFLGMLPLGAFATNLLEQNPFLPQGFNQTRPSQAAPAASAERVRFEFRGVVQMGDRTLLSIVEADSGRGTWIGPGQTRGGMEVLEYDPSSQTVTLLSGGQTFTLRLREATFGSGPDTSSAGAPGSGQGVVQNRPGGAVRGGPSGPATNVNPAGGSTAGRPGSSGGMPSVPTPMPRVRPDLPPTMQTPGAPPPFTPQLPADLTVPEVPPAVREAMRQQQEQPAAPASPVDFEAPRSLRDVMDREQNSLPRAPALPPGGIPPAPSGTPPPAPRN